MPWTAEDVDKHIKDLSSNEKETWVEVANKALAACEKAGRKNCDASAIKQANAVIGKLKEATINIWLAESVSYTALLEDIGNVVKKFASEKGWAYPVEVFDDSVVYEVSEPSQETIYFKASYTRDEAGAITLGAATKVKKVTSYQITEGFHSEPAGSSLTQEEFREEGALLEVEDE